MTEVVVTCVWMCHCLNCGAWKAPVDGRAPSWHGCGTNGRMFHSWMPRRPRVEIGV